MRKDYKAGSLDFGGGMGECYNIHKITKVVDKINANIHNANTSRHL